MRAFGVSNHTPRQTGLLKTAVEQPILINQVQLSITHSALVSQGMTSNMTTTGDATTRDGGGLVDYARINDITLQAWSPLQKEVSRESSWARQTIRNSMLRLSVSLRNIAWNPSPLRVPGSRVILRTCRLCWARRRPLASSMPQRVQIFR